MLSRRTFLAAPAALLLGCSSTHEPAPIASFTEAPASGTAPLAVQFSDHSLNAPTEWVWDFGDGNMSLSRNPLHTYATAGTYAATLKVTNGHGSNTSAVRSIAVALAPKLLWSDEFEFLDLASPTNVSGKWRPNDVWQPLDEGYADFATGQHSTWLINPAQKLPGTTFDPFSVSDSVLSISCTKTPTATLAAVNGCPWLGGLLVSNTANPLNASGFGYGYYEFRARFPIPGKGMFPALWFYAARDKNPTAQAAAEIDLFEIFGDGSGGPWFSTLHDSATQSNVVQVQSLDTSQWHTYGIDWTAEKMDFYYDRQLTSSAKPDTVRFFIGAKMAIRVDFVMDATFFDSGNLSDASTPDTLRLDLDYIRQYDKFA